LAEARILVLGDSERKKKRLSMTLEQFIRKNRRELDKAILRMYPNVKKLNDDERRVWILTDKFFYSWAKSAGVKF
jgi:hypothetical protein